MPETQNTTKEDRERNFDSGMLKTSSENCFALLGEIREPKINIRVDQLGSV
jgi:hypothetical protein